MTKLFHAEVFIFPGATLMAIPPKVAGASGFTVRVLVDTDSTFAYKKNSKVSGSGSQKSNVYGFFTLITFISFFELF